MQKTTGKPGRGMTLPSLATARTEGPSNLLFHPRLSRANPTSDSLAAARGGSVVNPADHLQGCRTPASIYTSTSALDVGAFVRLMKALPQSEAEDLCKRCMP